MVQGGYGSVDVTLLRFREQIACNHAYRKIS